jgi:hypothetical protein
LSVPSGINPLWLLIELYYAGVSNCGLTASAKIYVLPDALKGWPQHWCNGLRQVSSLPISRRSFRGTAPLTDAIRDQTVSRIWQGGIHFRPFQHLTLNFTGNYTRTNGLGEISGEPPLYGPVTFPYASGSIQYSFPRWGALGLQLQRTYYIEQIITANNFSAKLLLVNWTWSF